MRSTEFVVSEKLVNAPDRADAIKMALATRNPVFHTTKALLGERKSDLSSKDPCRG